MFLEILPLAAGRAANRRVELCEVDFVARVFDESSSISFPTRSHSIDDVGSIVVKNLTVRGWGTSPASTSVKPSERLCFTFSVSDQPRFSAGSRLGRWRDCKVRRRGGEGVWRTIGRDKGRPLTRAALPQANAYAMIRRRAAAAGIETKVGNHTFRATGITAYLKNGGTIEKARRLPPWPTTPVPAGGDLSRRP